MLSGAKHLAGNRDPSLPLRVTEGAATLRRAQGERPLSPLVVSLSNHEPRRPDTTVIPSGKFAAGERERGISAGRRRGAGANPVAPDPSPSTPGAFSTPLGSG